MSVILVVDDSVFLRQALSSVLSAAGYRAMTAVDGRHACSLAVKHRPDLIITDLDMPVMDGWQLLRCLLDHPGASSIPVLAISGAVEETIHTQALNAGFSAFLKKPFYPDQLLHNVATFVPTQRRNQGTETGK